VQSVLFVQEADFILRKFVKFIKKKIDFKKTRDLQKMLMKVWSFSELNSVASEGAQLMKVTASTKKRTAN
jgi:hypothetical protein